MPVASALTAGSARGSIASAMSQLRIQFAHGLHSGPQGNKGRLFAQHFDVRTPAMNTRDFEGCIAQHARELAEFQPQLLIGSSFGGAVVMALLQRGAWRGETLFLAQAARHYLREPRLPSGMRVTLVHGTRDEVVDVTQSRLLAATGEPDWVELIEGDDD